MKNKLVKLLEHYRILLSYNKTIKTNKKFICDEYLNDLENNIINCLDDYPFKNYNLCRQSGYIVGCRSRLICKTFAGFGLVQCETCPVELMKRYNNYNFPLTKNVLNVDLKHLIEELYKSWTDKDNKNNVSKSNQNIIIGFIQGILAVESRIDMSKAKSSLGIFND